MFDFCARPPGAVSCHRCDVGRSAAEAHADRQRCGVCLAVRESRLGPILHGGRRHGRLRQCGSNWVRLRLDPKRKLCCHWGGAGTFAGSLLNGNFVAIGVASSADGVNAVALGPLSHAAGDRAIAIGSSSNANGLEATAIGGGSTALGAAATATGTSSSAIGASATATGQASTASGTTASAFGQGSQAISNAATAIGQASTASAVGATAVGQGSAASGINATAVGIGASAAFNNSAAFGSGATASAPNQIAVGTTLNTYKLSGVASAASLSAQSGPIKVVTTDAAGNLATAAFSGVSNSQDIATLQSNVSTLQTQIRQAFEGTAMAIALGGSALPADKKFAFSANWGTFRGENAVGLSGQMRLSQYVVMNGGVASGFAQGGVGGRAGLTVAW